MNLNWATADDLAKISKSESGCRVGFCDWNFMSLSSTDASFNNAVSQFDYVFCDGYWVHVYNKLKNQESYYLTGPDMLQLVIESGEDLLFLGLSDYDLEKVRERFPDTRIENLKIPFVDDARDLDIGLILNAITKSQITNVFVSIGCPKQEKLMGLLGTVPKVNLFGTGAAVYFLTGKEKRAPRFIRAIKIEFIWRLLLNPKKQLKKWQNIFNFVFKKL